MDSYIIPDIRTGLCRAVIERAIRDIDPSATVAVNIERRVAEIGSNVGDVAIRGRLAQAGFRAERIG
ncbi:copper chaperone [Limimaricola variabilis]|jgi:copper chaperone|uniref:Copper chaperone n=1 Tax=Limimaricola variabilis TaxID=1492771 RepID=A0ABR6HPI3_9RHOB|nr:heavy-metal-associated domain-containing protein [Limimaricola variabilis]MBB3712477.1 copper chaperone [Limimaricola variabilis]WPY94643.1 heavy-metal-associated domain-containing protein [Limimaricola variabilis]